MPKINYKTILQDRVLHSEGKLTRNGKSVSFLETPNKILLIFHGNSVGELTERTLSWLQDKYEYGKKVDKEVILHCCYPCSTFQWLVENNYWDLARCIKNIGHDDIVYTQYYYSPGKIITGVVLYEKG